MIGDEDKNYVLPTCCSPCEKGLTDWTRNSPGFLLSKAFGTDLHHKKIFRWHRVRHICDQWIQDQQPRRLSLDVHQHQLLTDHEKYLQMVDNTRLSFGARAAGVHYHLFSVWTLVPVRLGKQLSGSSTVDEIASEAADCRLTYTMANCPQRR
ncbi:hypothetical protein TNCV_1155011 [Trichonephila clavipes]|nr:hypothetical protein TNCV_1155011 [Trichonephila clavipes]